MTTTLAPHLQSFAINDWMLETALRTIPEAAADRRIDPATNPARNIALHLLAARHGLCAMLGGSPAPLPWPNLGQDTKAGFGADAPRPALAAILEAWLALAPRFQSSLRDANATTLAAPSPMPIPGVTNPTLAQFAPLNVVHESYHLGQLGLIAKVVTGRGILNPPS